MADLVTVSVDEYNTEHFGVHFGDASRGEDPDRFRRANPVGTLAPDFPAVRLRDLANVNLSSYLGKGHVVLEFGSVT